MNIKILDSWLREFVETEATPKELAKALSLSSVGVERIVKSGNDYIYDIEVTTNRPDLMSVVGIAREAGVVLSQFGIPAKFKSVTLNTMKSLDSSSRSHVTQNDNEALLSGDHPIEIKNDSKLVNRMMAVVIEVNLKKSPEKITKRLEATDIRSLNNIIDVTNYVMRETGHPAHVFDYDRLTSKKLIIRPSKPGEEIVTLDEKVHKLAGGDIVADNGKGEIVDLLGIMGTANSVVTENTKRILFFLDNNNPHLIRKTSMNLGIRTEAAQINEKGVDPELMPKALMRGIELYKEIAEGVVISDIIDIYPNKPEPITVSISTDKIRSVIGVDIPDKQIKTILENLGFDLQQINSMLSVKVPSWRLGDVEIEEDIIEEVARVYGYYNLPSILPPTSTVSTYHQSEDPFYWEKRVKSALKYWGFTETYSYSMVSKDLYEGDTGQAVTIKNPLDEDHIYMRKSLIPSMLEVIQENDDWENIRIFELSNIYISKTKSLPNEVQHLGIIIKKDKVSFLEMKGYVEALLHELGITDIEFKISQELDGAEVYIDKTKAGVIEILDKDLVDTELDFSILLKHATLTKKLAPIPKHPPIIEDIRLQIPTDVTYAQTVHAIQKQSSLIKTVELLDTYETKKTFRITYQDLRRNLTNEDVTEIRKKIIAAVEKEIRAKVV